MIGKYLPNLITLLNLLAGCVSILYAASGELNKSAFLILFAAVFDFLDGFMARMLNGMSSLGKQLDSLADVVSFGLAPAMILHVLLRNQMLPVGDTLSVSQLTVSSLLLLFSPFLITLFSALRLAKFNLDEEQHNFFKGLPTPACALFISGLAFAAGDSEGHILGRLTGNEWFILILILVLSVLLVSRIGMFSMKMKSFGLRENGVRYAFLAGSLALLLFFHLSGLAYIVIFYILISLLTTHKKLNVS